MTHLEPPATGRFDTHRARFTVLAPGKSSPATITAAIGDDLEPMNIHVEPYTDEETRHDPARIGCARVSLTNVPYEVTEWFTRHRTENVFVETWSRRPKWELGDTPGSGYLRSVIRELEVVSIVHDGTTDRAPGQIYGRALPIPPTVPYSAQAVVLGLVRVTPADQPADTADAVVMDLRRPEGSEHLGQLIDPGTGIMFVPVDQRPVLTTSPSFSGEGYLAGFAARIDRAPHRLMACLLEHGAVRVETWSRVPQPDPELFAKFTAFRFEVEVWEIDGSTGPMMVAGALLTVEDPDQPGKTLMTRTQITDEVPPAPTPLPAPTG